MKTTLNAIRSTKPFGDIWATLLNHLGKTESDDEPIAIAEILNVLTINDALWCLRGVTGHDREIRLYAIWCMRRVQHLMRDPRSIAALDVAERFANGQATDVELEATLGPARNASIVAWAVARAVGDDEYDVERYAARAAGELAWVIAGPARERAWDAAQTTADYACAVARADAKKRWSDAVAVADYARAARTAEWDALSAELRRICEVAP